jgi:regulator of RNase E activity RraB
MSLLNHLFKPKSALPKYNSNVRSYLDSYDEKPVYTIVDLGLAEIAPVAGYDRYIAVILPVQINGSGEGAPVGDGELKSLHKIEERCIREAEAKGFLYAGHAIVTAAEHMYIAFYCKETDKDEIINNLLKICQANGREPTRILSKEDHEWGFYLERLYPDIYSMQPLNHQEIVEDVRKHGDSGQLPRSVAFWLYFSTKEDAEACLEEAADQGFLLDTLADLREDKQFKGNRPFALTIKKDMALNVDEMNAEAWKLIDLAKEYDGEYDGIETDVIKGK